MEECNFFITEAEDDINLSIRKDDEETDTTDSYESSFIDDSSVVSIFFHFLFLFFNIHSFFSFFFHRMTWFSVTMRKLNLYLMKMRKKKMMKTSTSSSECEKRRDYSPPPPPMSTTKKMLFAKRNVVVGFYLFHHQQHHQLQNEFQNNVITDCCSLKTLIENKSV